MIEPDYYKNNGKDLIEVFSEQMSKDQFRGFMIGNIVKYLTRYEQKNGVEDLEKAQTYLQRLADFEDPISERKNVLYREVGGELRRVDL